MRIGTKVGPYEVTAVLGAGGMGQVWRAHDSRLGRDVAVKVLPAEFASDPERLQRFEREARATAALSHPNILGVFDIGSHDGEPYIIEELVEGESLRTLLRRSRLALDTVVELAVQIARGLAAAHDRSIVHRDLKPDNVIVTADGVAKILDFGLAKFVAATPQTSAATLTHVPTGATELGAVLGTAAYMAPEQALGRAVDQRADVFAFGVVLYEMLCGRRPFDGATGTEIMAAILKDEPLPLPESVPAQLRQIVGRCLHKAPAERFASAREVLAALQTPSAVVVVAPTEPHWRRLSRRVVLAAATVVAIAVLGVAVIVIVRGRGATTAPATGPDPRRVVVMPFENMTGEPSLDPIAARTADAVTQGLVELGKVEVVPVPGGSPTGDAAASLHAARDAGAGTVVSGSYYLTGDAIDLRGRVTDAASGKPIFALKPERGPRGQPDAAIDRVRQRVMGALLLRVGDAPGLGGLTTPPLYSAYQEFLSSARAMGVDRLAQVAHLERAVAIDPEFWHAQIVLQWLYKSRGETAKFEAMKKHLQENQDEFGPLDRILMQFHGASAERRTLEAYRKARELHALAPHDFMFVVPAALLAQTLNRPREALEHIGDVEKFDWKLFGQWTQGSWVLGVAALSHHRLGEYEAELAVAEFGVRIYPDILKLSQDRVRALAALGRLAEVERVVTESLAMRSRTGTPGEVMLTAAQELRAHGHPDEARRMASRGADWYAALTGDEASPAATSLNRVECLWLAERWQDARSLADAVVESRPTDIFARGYRGIIAARAGDRAVAEKADRDLAAEDDVRLRGNGSWLRACIAAQGGERDQALELLRVALAHGVGAGDYLHVYAFLEPLHGYPPFEELIEPKG